MSMLQEGQIIRGTYEIERLLGQGAFAEVYRVKHRFLGRQAMKVFRTISMTVEDVEQMLDEPILLSRIGHPNIIKVFEANVAEMSTGIYGFFTMEYIAGGSLEQFWHSHGKSYVPVETCVDIFRQVCRGLEVAHTEQPPIIHRDIKPQNILVGVDPGGLRVRVSDFGLARHVNPMTLMATAKGTRGFKPPEVFQNIKSDSCAGDIWAMGTTFYLLLTDRLPFPDIAEMTSFDETGFKRPIIPPSRFNLQVDPLLDQIILSALALKPEDRYPTAREMLADLEKWKPVALEGMITKNLTSDAAKSALGIHSPADEEQARSKARQALHLASQANKLVEAADLMEEAFNKWAGLRNQYESLVKLWRCGICTPPSRSRTGK